MISCFPEDVEQEEMISLRLADGGVYRANVSSNVKTVASSFGLLAVLLASPGLLYYHGINK